MKYLRYIFIFIILYYLVIWYSTTISKERSNSLTYHEFQKESIKRPYYLSSNAKNLKGKNAPLIIFLHGIDQKWPQETDTKLQYNFINSLAQKNDFIAVFPRGSKGSCDWEANKYKDYYCWSTREDFDTIYIEALINEIQKAYQANHQKAYLTGFSNGAYFVVDYLLRHHSNLFNGYGILSGGGYILEDDPVKNYRNKFSIFMSVGVKDPYEFDGMTKLKNSLLELGWQPEKNLKFYEFNGDHELTKDTLAEAINFFLKAKSIDKI